MVAYNKTKDVRVVTYLPDETNRKLQAYASLDGVSKQELTRNILVEWVAGAEGRMPKTTKKPAKEQAE